MKKLFSIFALTIFLFMQALPAFSHAFPRWQFFPVKTYVEEHPKKPIVMRALKEWEKETGMAKFFYVDTERKIPKIIIEFDEKCGDEGSGHAVGLTYSYTPQGYYATAKVKVFLRNPITDWPLTDDEIYAVALHEIGHALGLKHTNHNTDIMFYRLNTARHLTPNDLKQFDKLYR